MFEHKQDALLTRAEFFFRMTRNGVGAVVILIVSLVVGVLGYHLTEGHSWLDSLLNASMLLGGMGPVDKLQTDSGKIFASFYALFCGLMFLVTVGLLFAPLVHRLMHRFHLECEDEEALDRPRRRSSSLRRRLNNSE